MRTFLLVVALIALAACGSTGNDAPERPAPSACPASASSAVPTASQSVYVDHRAIGVAYMCSTERLKAYDDMWPIAKRVAQGILDNKFGTFQSLMPDKATAVASAYTGQGGLYALNEQAYAYVWFKDGKVDFSKEVTAFSLYGVLIDKGSNDTLYGVRIKETGFSWVMNPNYFGGESPKAEPSEEQVRYPVSEQEAKALDSKAQLAIYSGLLRADV